MLTLLRELFQSWLGVTVLIFPGILYSCPTLVAWSREVGHWMLPVTIPFIILLGPTWAILTWSWQVLAGMKELGLASPITPLYALIAMVYGVYKGSVIATRIGAKIDNRLRVPGYRKLNAIIGWLGAIGCASAAYKGAKYMKNGRLS